MFTSIAEAYQESLPVLFITAHGTRDFSKNRYLYSQELEIVECVKNITKYAANIESVEEAKEKISKACEIATTGRTGPVVIDINSSLWNKEIILYSNDTLDYRHEKKYEFSYIEKIEQAICMIKSAKRPIILIGDGVRRVSRRKMCTLSERIAIPVLSSRASQDILCGTKYYYGYIGSHGTRYSNFVLEKADVILCIGNRMAFPPNSQSYSPMMEKKKIIRIDIDENEFSRNISNSLDLHMDAEIFVEYILKRELCIEKKEWIQICDEIKERLNDWDCIEPVKQLQKIIEGQKENSIYVCDVGNNEFWFSRAVERCSLNSTVLYSKNFGTLGVSLGRAIGVYYASRKDVVCVLGDQALQYNVAALHYISCYCLPIMVIVINNCASGMILDHEKKLSFDKLIHVSKGNGYNVVPVKEIATAYGLNYVDFNYLNESGNDLPLICEVKLNDDIELIPILEKSKRACDMTPLLDRKLFEYIDRL